MDGGKQEAEDGGNNDNRRRTAGDRRDERGKKDDSKSVGSCPFISQGIQGFGAVMAADRVSLLMSALKANDVVPLTNPLSLVFLSL